MNIWIEYFKYKDKRKNTHAQFKERAKWIPPDPKDVHKRFCLNRKQAVQMARHYNERGYHATIKTDGMGNV